MLPPPFFRGKNFQINAPCGMVILIFLWDDDEILEECFAMRNICKYIQTLPWGTNEIPDGNFSSRIDSEKGLTMNL